MSRCQHRFAFAPSAQLNVTRPDLFAIFPRHRIYHFRMVFGRKNNLYGWEWPSSLERKSQTGRCVWGIVLILNLYFLFWLKYLVWSDLNDWIWISEIWRVGYLKSNGWVRDFEFELEFELCWGFIYVYFLEQCFRFGRVVWDWNSGGSNVDGEDSKVPNLSCTPRP